MLTKITIFALSTVALASIAAPAQDKLPSLAGKSSFRLERNDGAIRAVSDNTRFRSVNNGDSWTLYEERFVTRETATDTVTNLTTTAFRVTESNKTQMWSLRVLADEASNWYEFYRTLAGGCCGDDDTYTYYSTGTGREIYRSNFELLKIEVPNTRLQRFVGALQAEQFRYVTLQYGDAERVHKRYRVKVIGQPRLDAVELATNKDRHAKTVTLWAHEQGKDAKAALSGFEVVLTYSSDEIISIPVQNDELLISKAKLPRGATIVELPPESKQTK